MEEFGWPPGGSAKTHTRRRWITFSGVLLLYCASAPFIAHPLFRYAENHAIKKSPQDVPRADAIVVLGGGC